MKIGQSAGKDYAYLVGVYLGDGCVTNYNDHGTLKRQFRLNTIDEDFAAATAVAIVALSPSYKPTICKHSVKGGRDNYALSHRDRTLCEALVADTDDKKKIPEWLLTAPRDVRTAFVAGVMDSEGFVAHVKIKGVRATNRSYAMGYKSCDTWIPQFLKILDSLGVRYGKVYTEKPRKPWYKTPTGFRIKMQSWVDAGCYFNIARKQSRVTLWASAPAYAMRATNPRRSTPETTRRAA